jgi:hypothetical protein
LSATKYLKLLYVDGGFYSPFPLVANQTRERGASQTVIFLNHLELFISERLSDFPSSHALGFALQTNDISSHAFSKMALSEDASLISSLVQVMVFLPFPHRMIGSYRQKHIVVLSRFENRAGVRELDVSREQDV